MLFTALSGFDGFSLLVIKSKSSKSLGEDRCVLEWSVFGLHGSTAWGLDTGETGFHGSLPIGFGGVTELTWDSACNGAQGSTIETGDVLLGFDTELFQGSTESGDVLLGFEAELFQGST